MNQIINYASNFVNNPTVRDVAYKTAQVTVAGIVAGVANMTWTSLSTYHDGDCTAPESWTSFKVGFLTGSTLKTMQIAGVFSHPRVTSLVDNLREVYYIKTIVNFLTTV